MSMVVNTNVLSLIAQTNLANTNNKLNTAVEQLSSGLRINSAMDDPAGLAIGTAMQSQVNGMNQGVINANAAISLSQVADGALGSVSNMLQQMRTLAVEAANGTNSTASDADLDAEYQQLATQISQTLANTQFNGQSIFSQAGTVTYQVGANTTDVIGVAGMNIATNAVLTTTDLGALTTASAATTAMTAIDTALSLVNTTRANNGANEIRFQQVVSTMQVNSQNTAAAESQIMDTNYAQATSNLTQAEIVQQAGTAMLSQANMIPQNVLTLLSKLP
ncbi:Flagellin domain protein [Burkholderiales bacterium]|jgi:flagellin|nr:Flagellin domain protein [Burkholderiales bacterium]